MLYNIVLLLPCINMNPPYHPSGSSQCTSPKHPVSCIKPGLAIRFIYDMIHVSVPFSQINPPSPSPTESKTVLYSCVSFAVSQGYCYHLSKFHIYALVYCIGISCQLEWLQSESLQAINAGEGVEKREPSYIVGGNAN